MEDLFAGVHPQWRDFLRADKALLEHLASALRETVSNPAVLPTMVPDIGHIFEFLRYSGPDDCGVVIVGQDPYFTVVAGPGSSRIMQAQGLAFSCNPRVSKAQPSLANIQSAVVADVASLSGLSAADYLARLAAAQGGRKVNLLDLRFWAAQGVLMMNRALTTKEGQAKAHMSHWLPFTNRFIELLAARRARAQSPLVFMLWGVPAKKLEPAIKRAGAGAEHIRVLTWSHPSPLSDNGLPPDQKFAACGHFKAANAMLTEARLRPVAWLDTPVVAACDGGCTGNGKAHAKAGFGAVVAGGALAGMQIFGRVCSAEYKFADGARPDLGIFPVSGTSVLPSNNRGEYLGACYLMLALVRAGVTAPVEIVSDSKLFIMTMTTWLPGRKKKGTEAELKNYDLVQIANTLLSTLKTQCRGGVKLTHINSHKPEPLRPADGGSSREHLLWSANDLADRLATMGIESDKRVVCAPPPFWLP